MSVSSKYLLSHFLDWCFPPLNFSKKPCFVGFGPVFAAGFGGGLVLN